ncbi:MAG TPA: excinuclease ABC subunit UvrC [Rhabdochlamydiaceae bacterium]|nr:excinuclease ABC subunit UvrC [Rhabdochlamydiaceae bacterium]
MASFDSKHLDVFPVQPGVYLMKDAAGNIIYIGKAKQLKNRLKQYFSSGGDGRPMVPFLTAQIAHIDTIIVFSEKEALLLENTLIKRHKPKFNALLKDDKTFISLMINNRHRWPMIRLIRYKGKPKEAGLYFGPYTNAFAARQTFELLTHLFPLRQCSDEELKRRTRPCLLYSIKRCIAPCVEKCTKEEYDEFVDGAIQFLKGQNKEIIKKLYDDMEKASANMEYEQAADLLRTIRQVEYVIESHQVVIRSSAKDCDALAIHRQADEVILMQLLFREGSLIGSEHYSFSNVAEDDPELLESFILQHYKEHQAIPSEILLPFDLHQADVLSEILYEVHKKKIHIFHPQKGNKRALVDLAVKNAKATFQQEKDHQELREKMLIDLQETLGLNRYPKRIECFDTSNISGSNLVACMVAFTNGEKDRKRTRLFKIKNINQADDYGALHQVLSRRLIRAKEEDDLPDLIIVDGGKGQLNVALDVFKELDIATVDVISIAKEKGRHDKGMTEERIFLPHHKEPLQFQPRSPLLFLLQKIRDEAHRKAIGFQQVRRKKSSLASSLDEIPGIGEIKRKRLLRHFGSLKRIKEASEEELSQIKGLTKKDIKTILSL